MGDEDEHGLELQPEPARKLAALRLGTTGKRPLSDVKCEAAPEAACDGGRRFIPEIYIGQITGQIAAQTTPFAKLTAQGPLSRALARPNVGLEVYRQQRRADVPYGLSFRHATLTCLPYGE
jgi:hypothetical protein